MATDRYSTSTEEQDTMYCFFDFQAIGDGPRETKKPAKEHQAIGPNQSHSMPRDVNQKLLEEEDLVKVCFWCDKGRELHPSDPAKADS